MKEPGYVVYVYQLHTMDIITVHLKMGKGEEGKRVKKKRC